MSYSSELGCPVCQARFRGTVACSRCGADLAPLMRLVVVAFDLRRRSRAALARRDFRAALRLAVAAQERHATRAGARLDQLARLAGELL